MSDIADYGWKMFMYGVIAANQVWLMVIVLYVVPKMNELRQKAKGPDV